MTMLATHAPSDYISATDDNLRLSLIDPYHALVRAIIKRAYWDSVGRVGGSKTRNEHYRIMQDASRFFSDGRCLHLVECLGCDPEKLGGLGR